MVSNSIVDTILGTSILFVEGQDDKHFVWQFCRQMDSIFLTERSGHELYVTVRANSRKFRIEEQGNRTNLIDSIRQQAVSASRQPFGVIIDSDSSAVECWSDLVAGFERTGIALPPSPEVSGTIISEHGFLPRVGIWLMPDNKSPGEMEDFANEMIPANDPVWPLSRQYIETIPPEQRKFVAEKMDKAKFFAWLAARREPGRAGAAIGARDLETNGQRCQDFLNWIVRLFD